MRFKPLLAVTSLAICTTCLSTPQNQIPLFPNALRSTEKDVDKVLNHEFSDYVERMTEKWEVKGTTIAVVRPDGEVEFGAYGIKTEDGEKITPEVCASLQ